MPYTPPAQQSPATSARSSPALSRSSSYCEDGPRSPTVGRPTPPRSNSSTSYLHKHRRSPSIQSDRAPPTPTEGLDSNTAETDFALIDSKHDPLPANPVIPQGGMPSPPDSSENSDGDENNAGRGRDWAKSWTELQEAVRGISQRRGSSPEKKPGAKKTGTASEPSPQITSPLALTAEARKISHSRSSTELYIPPRATFESPNQTSDDSEEDSGDSNSRPSLIRKKSGELVKPALRPSSRRRYSSMPGTPTYSKTVHFNDNDNQTRHFLQVDKPIAVSAGTSPIESYESENEYPFEREKKVEREIRLCNFPADTIDRRTMPIRVERIFLSPDKNTLIGVCTVQNLSFHKLVVARFTLDYWKTTSEVVAEYNNDPKFQPADGCDRFNFNIKLSDQKNIEEKTLLLCVRYNVGGQEFWDNNDNTNYQIDFTKVAVPSTTKTSMTNGLGARPLSAIPRSRHTSPNSSRGRQESLDDDFAVRLDREYTYSLTSADNLLGASPSSIKLKARGKRGSIFPTAADSSPSNGLGGRYDFGASLSAALTSAQEKITRQSAVTSDKDQAVNGSYFGPIERLEGPIKSEERPDAITTDRPAMGSDQYKDLVQKFCYFTPTTGKQATASPQPENVNKSPSPQKSSVESTDGTVEHIETASDASSGSSSGSSSPLAMSSDRPASSGKGAFSSRSNSPSPLTSGMGGRAASPINFGYPYHHNSNRNGYLSESTTPTAIQT